MFQRRHKQTNTAVSLLLLMVKTKEAENEDKNTMITPEFYPTGVLKAFGISRFVTATIFYAVLITRSVIAVVWLRTEGPQFHL